MTLGSPEDELGRLDRSRAARINLIANYASIAVAMLQGVVMVPLYLSRLGRETYGIWLVTGNIVGWLSIIDPGLSAVIQQQVAEAAGGNNRKRVEELLGVAVVASGALVATALAAGWLLWWVMARSMPGAGTISGLVYAYVLAVIATAMMLGYYLFAGVFIGLQTTGALSIFYVGSSIAGVATMAFGLYSGWGLVSLGLGRCVTAFVLFGAAGLLTHLKLRKRFGLRFAFSGATIRELMGRLKYSVFARAIGVIASNVDSVALGWWMGPSDAVLLTVNRKAADICSMAVDRIGVSFMPGLAHGYGAGDRRGFEAAARRVATTYAVVLAIAAGGVLAFNRLFVHTWVGGENVGTLGLTAAVVVAMVGAQIGSLLANVYLSMGKIAETARVSIGETLTRLALLSGGLMAGLGALAVPGAVIGGVFTVTIPYYLARLSWLRGDALGRRALIGVLAIIGLAVPIAFRSFSPGWVNFAAVSGGYAVVAGLVGLIAVPSIWRRKLAPPGGAGGEGSCFEG